MDEGTELEKAPAAVAVKVVRKASGRVQKGRAINVSYGMRSIKMIAPRRNRNVKKEIRLGEESKTIKKHVSRLFMARCEEGNAKEVDTSYLEAYQKRWENIEVGIDLALEKVVKPVCERTLEVAQDLDQTSCIPQLVPVIFHDATAVSSLDYSKFFDSTVLQFKRGGYSVVRFVSEDLPLFKKLGVWSALLTLIAEQNKDVSLNCGGKQMNSAVSRRLLEELCGTKNGRIILAAENLETFDKGTLGEIIFALSEVWDTIPVTLLIGQFVKKDCIYSAIPKNVLTKLYPTSVSIPSGYKIVETILQNVLLGFSSGSGGEGPSPLLVGPSVLHRLCELMLDYQCSTYVLKRFLKSVYLRHVVNVPMYTFCMNRKTKACSKLTSQLRQLLNLKGSDRDETLWQACQGEETKLQSLLYSFGIRVRLINAAASALFNNEDIYLKLLKAAAYSLASKNRKQVWAEDSLFHGLKKGILRGSKQRLDALVKQWKEVVDSAESGGDTEGSLSELSRRIALLSNFDPSTAELAGLAERAERVSPSASTQREVQMPVRGGSRRMQALQSHISSLSDGSDTAVRRGEEHFQQSCADFFIALCEVPDQQNPGHHRLSRTLVVESDQDAVGMVMPSIPRDMISSITDPRLFLQYTEARDSLQNMEDSAIVFHFIKGFTSSIPMEEVFDQFSGAVIGEIKSGSATGKRKRRAKTAQKKGSEQKEALNLRFERAIQELNLCGLIKINKRKMNKFVSVVF